ncbi:MULTISPECIES: Csu type fimbrial protein [Sphingomonas]|uniref:Spore coat U domain-containing protein n=1 Tax=Sphingomonas molluscorum TaxID=418184 RepID=A0ABU8Q3Z1_9SPHN|nr:spore coat U domain-containing protein [Sphingomonas sp. JUb134]MBM7405982.1 spore coat protein U-like protein [Sphingomonas sp. JUb134]
MPLADPGPVVLDAKGKVLLLLLVCMSGLMLLLLPERAQANVVCSANSAGLNFGSALSASATISYNCTNYDPTPVTFTLCAGIGNPSYPGTADQPKLLNGNQTVNFNLYTDAAGANVWTKNNPITTTVTIAPNGASVSGVFQFFGRIPPGQQAPVGTYTAAFYNTVLGFMQTGVPTCERSGQSGLSGIDFTLSIQASIADTCNLGTIGAVDFGAQPGLWNRVDATGSVQLSCPSARVWALRFDGGRYASGGDRRMRNAAGDHVVYRLYTDAGRNSTLGIDGTINGVGTSAVQSIPVYGRIEAGAPPAIGNYSDFVVVTLSF